MLVLRKSGGPPCTGLDLKKMPMGTLSKKQMKSGAEKFLVLAADPPKGYACLKDLMAILDGTTEVLDAEHKSALLTDATNRFYNAIPHSFSRYSSPPVIRFKWAVVLAIYLNQ